jgi:hypothetical protein
MKYSAHVKTNAPSNFSYKLLSLEYADGPGRAPSFDGGNGGISTYGQHFNRSCVSFLLDPSKGHHQSINKCSVNMIPRLMEQFIRY